MEKIDAFDLLLHRIDLFYLQTKKTVIHFKCFKLYILFEFKF